MSVCLNCKAAVYDKFCSECGQQTKIKRAAIIDVVRDSLADFFAFDSRIFKSFIPLLIRPGRITEMYLEGKRTQLISPVRMYIFISFVFFFFALPDSSALNFNSGELNVDADTQQRFTNMLDDSIRRLPHFLLLSVPLLAMVLGIAHRKPKTFLYDHLVFSLHIHTFLFLSMMALIFIGSQKVTLYFIPLYFIYWVIAIKRCYKRSWKVTIPKTMVLFMFDPIILGAMAITSLSEALKDSGLEQQF